MDSVEQQFIESLKHLSGSDKNAVLEALDQTKKWHEGQLRDTGEAYVTHPIAAAGYLASLEAGKKTLMAALLHDVVEDERASLQQVKDEFGETIATLVDGVTKLSKLHYEGRRAERQVESLRKMLLTASDDLRVIIIKLADRWHNVSTLDSLREDKQQRIADETLDIYVPFARLMGFWELKSYFEDVCFPIAFSEESHEWHEAISQARCSVEKDRMDFIRRVNAETSEEVEAQLHTMTDYEIFKKLQGNKQRLKNVQNIDSVLIIIKGEASSPLDCYRVLGEIHARYPVRVGSFRDYISAPQPNGYCALHSTIFLSRGHQLCLRIQTQEMYEFSSKRKLSSWVNERDNDVYRALASLHRTSYDKEHYLEDLKGTVLKKRINVFTVSGEIVTLPSEATGVDFAFAINPDHVAYLSGIRVNGELHEATHVLKDGDTVQLVLLDNGTGEMRTMWVDKVKSVEAREELKKSLGDSPESQRMEEGRKILEIELRKRKLPCWWLFHLSAMQEDLAAEMKKGSFEKLLDEIGSGVVPVVDVTDTYKKMLTTTPSRTFRLLKFLHLLPRSRVLNKEATLIDIEVLAEDRQGLIHDITGCFSERAINIAKFGVYAVPPRDALYKVRLEVSSFEEFSNLYDSLIQIPSVKTILRKK